MKKMRRKKETKEEGRGENFIRNQGWLVKMLLPSSVLLRFLLLFFFEFRYEATMEVNIF